MKRQQFSEPRSGKLVCQLLGGVTFAYDFCLGCSRDRWKGIAKDNNSGMGLGKSLWFPPKSLQRQKNVV